MQTDKYDTVRDECNPSRERSWSSGFGVGSCFLSWGQRRTSEGQEALARAQGGAAGGRSPRGTSGRTFGSALVGERRAEAPTQGAQSLEAPPHPKLLLSHLQGQETAEKAHRAPDCGNEGHQPSGPPALVEKHQALL